MFFDHPKITNQNTVLVGDRTETNKATKKNTSQAKKNRKKTKNKTPEKNKKTTLAYPTLSSGKAHAFKKNINYYYSF